MKESLACVLSGALSLAACSQTVTAQDSTYGAKTSQKHEEGYNLIQDIQKGVAERVADGVGAASEGDILAGIKCISDAAVNTVQIPIRGIYALARVEGPSDYDPLKAGGRPVMHMTTEREIAYYLSKDRKVNIVDGKTDREKLEAILHFFTIPIDAPRIAFELNVIPIYEQAGRSFKKGDIIGGLAKGACGTMSALFEPIKATDWLGTHYTMMILSNKPLPPEDK